MKKLIAVWLIKLAGKLIGAKVSSESKPVKKERKDAKKTRQVRKEGKQKRKTTKGTNKKVSSVGDLPKVSNEKG